MMKRNRERQEIGPHDSQSARLWPRGRPNHGWPSVARSSAPALEGHSSAWSDSSHPARPSLARAVGSGSPSLRAAVSIRRRVSVRTGKPRRYRRSESGCTPATTAIRSRSGASIDDLLVSMRHVITGAQNSLPAPRKFAAGAGSGRILCRVRSGGWRGIRRSSASGSRSAMLAAKFEEQKEVLRQEVLSHPLVAKGGNTSIADKIP
jgi:hypothetical protein